MNRAPVRNHVEEVMGTVVSFVVPMGDMPERRVTNALKDACRVLHEADEVFSTWNRASPMSRVRRGELALTDAPPVMREVLATCELARELSGGWFDPWAMPGGVDPTGLVKGWAAQRAAGELRSAGITSAMVNAAGDIVALGEREPGRAWRVGVRDPRRPERLAFIVPIEGADRHVGSLRAPGTGPRPARRHAVARAPIRDGHGTGPGNGGRAGHRPAGGRHRGSASHRCAGGLQRLHHGDRRRGPGDPPAFRPPLYPAATPSPALTVAMIAPPRVTETNELAKLVRKKIERRAASTTSSTATTMTATTIATL